MSQIQTNILSVSAVVIGFSQPHYKVNEGDCVRVCAQVFAGQFKPSDSVSFFITLGILGPSKLYIWLFVSLFSVC